MESKKAYQTPDLVALGSVESITQAIIFPGSGDILSALTPDPDDTSGCYFDQSPLCQGGGGPGTGS